MPRGSGGGGGWSEPAFLPGNIFRSNMRWPMFGELVNGPRPPTGIDGAPDPAGTTAAAINAMDILIPPLKPKFYSRGGAVSPLAGLTMKRRMGDIRPSMLDPDEVVFTPHQLDALRIAASAKPKLRKDQIQAIRLAHRT